MADVTTYQAIPIKDLLGDLAQYKYNPTLIQRKILDHLEDITSGQIDIVDPTNPFIFLLEASCVNTALSIQENTNDLRKTYPALLQTQEDAYLHMSDQDYLDRFSTPATATFTMYMELNSLLANLVDVPNQNYSQATIPRNTEIVIDNITFSLQYPIDIRRYQTGIFQISYDTAQDSPFQSLATNIIDYAVQKDMAGVSWVVIKLPLTQFKINTAQYPVQLSKVFIESITYTDRFYAARVYYRPDGHDEWVEMRTTHTDQVYDPMVPTAVLTVFDGLVRVFIPPVYTMQGPVSGTIRVDVYGTRGRIDVNFSNYPLADFQVVLLAIDEERDISTYTNAFVQVSHFAMTTETVVSGADGYTFEQLREAVIMNSIGDRQLPITQNQIQHTIESRGFQVHKNIDVITDRVFLATRPLPPSNDRYPITPISTTVATLVDSVAYLRQHDAVIDNSERLTIPSYQLFELVNSTLSLVDIGTKQWLSALDVQTYIEVVNSRTFLSNPFHYVLDFSSDEFDLRAYVLDHPTADTLNFIDQNSSHSYVVNTSGYSVTKMDYGYLIEIITKSGDGYKSLADTDVGVQLIYSPPGQGVYGYMEGSFVGRTESGERQYRFELHTNYDINSSDHIYFTNFRIPTNDHITLPSLLDQSFTLIHYTRTHPQSFKPIAADGLLGAFMSTTPIFAVTHESFECHFGDSLKNLWRHSRSSVGGGAYQVHEYDVPMYYERNIYEVDPRTGMMFTMGDDCTFKTTLLHASNEIVKDAAGDIVYKYRKGDVKRDAQGNPIPIEGIYTVHYMDLLLLDYRACVATSDDHRAYLRQIVDTIVSWVMNDISALSQMLLERTRIYYIPKKNIGQISVMVADGLTQYIDILQSLKVQYYVNNSVYNDSEIRASIDYRTVKILAEQITLNRVSIADILQALKDEFGDTIDTVNVSGLGGIYDLKLCYVTEEGSTLALNKKLVRQPNGDLSLMEDVAIEYIDVEQ